MDEVLTTKEAAEELGVTPARVRQLIMEGRLPAIKRGRDSFIKKGDLDKVRDRKPGRKPSKKAAKEARSKKR